MREKVGYNIYHPTKADIQISKRLLGLQTSFCAKLVAIYKTLKQTTTKYPNKPTHIFTDCLNCLYLVNTQVKHPNLHINHADQSILASKSDIPQ
jgi:hypothetical protein